MSHIPIDLGRRDRVMSVCMCVTLFCVANNSRTIFMPRPEQELFHELAGILLGCLIKIY